MRAHFILYVEDQARSTAFYSHVLGSDPSLNVPGMTEFTLSENSILGLMPFSAIKRLLGDQLFEKPLGNSVHQCELYLLVNDPLAYHQRAIGSGAIELSPLEERNWGHRAAYSLDPDGHILAFAGQIDLEPESQAKQPHDNPN